MLSQLQGQNTFFGQGELCLMALRVSTEQAHAAVKTMVCLINHLSHQQYLQAFLHFKI